MNKEVVTIGLGYIGLPTSALIASHGTNVLGVDINQNVVDTINEGKIHIVEPDLDKIVSSAVSKGNLKASTKPISAEVYLIVVPTPFKGNHEPDISFIEAATKGIIPLLKKGDLSFFNDETELVTTFIKELKEEIPEKLNTPSIQARISVLETCFFKLEGIKDLNCPFPDIKQLEIREFYRGNLKFDNNFVDLVNNRFDVLVTCGFFIFIINL